MPGTFTYAAATNIVTVTGGTSGSPADFASFVTVDRANAATLLAAWAPISNTKALTYQVRPVELLALLISFVVAGKTAETDYIFITGTDWLGNAQTESINVSAGNGTYVTTKYFRTITNIDCSDNPAGGGVVWANGTVAVTQPIWGVIWDKGNGQYRLDCFFSIGNGSTSTFFTDTNKDIVMPDGIRGVAVNNIMIDIFANATLTLGTLVDATNHIGKDGCTVRFLESVYTNNTIRVRGYANLYACTFVGVPGSITKSIVDFYKTNVTLYDCSFLNNFFPQGVANIYRLNRIGSNSAVEYGIYESPLVAGSDMLIANVVFGIVLKVTTGVTMTLYNIILSNIATNEVYTLDSQGTIYLVNCDLGTANPRFKYHPTLYGGNIYLQYTIDLHLTDEAGVDISGATVTLTSPVLGEIFSVPTGADGKIAQQTVSRGYYTKVNGDTLTDYGPHTLTITQPGFLPYQDVITLDRKMDLEVALRRPLYQFSTREVAHAVA